MTEAIDARVNRNTSVKKTRQFDYETFRLDALGITHGEREAVKARRLMRISDGYKTRLVKYAYGGLALYIKLRKDA
jgi:hypothetical protein